MFWKGVVGPQVWVVCVVPKYHYSSTHSTGNSLVHCNCLALLFNLHRKKASDIYNCDFFALYFVTRSHNIDVTRDQISHFTRLTTLTLAWIAKVVGTNSSRGLTSYFDIHVLKTCLKCVYQNIMDWTDTGLSYSIFLMLQNTY